MREEEEKKISQLQKSENEAKTSHEDRERKRENHFNFTRAKSCKESVRSSFSLVHFVHLTCFVNISRRGERNEMGNMYF